MFEMNEFPKKIFLKKLFKKCSHDILHVENAVQICSHVHADTF